MLHADRLAELRKPIRLLLGLPTQAHFMNECSYVCGGVANAVPLFPILPSSGFSRAF